MSQNSLNETAVAPIRRRGRQGLWIGVSLVALGVVGAACSSETNPPGPSDISSSSSSGGSSGGPGVDGSLPPDGEAPDAGALPDARDELSYVPIEGGDPGITLVCEENAVVFNLTKLGPDNTLPADFITAWDFEVGNPLDTFRPPALVLAATGLKSGPINIRIGGTTVTNGVVSVPAAGAGTATIVVPYNAAQKQSLVAGPVAANFALTFGPLNSRRTITATAVQFAFEVDVNCDELNGTLSVEIPGGPNASIPFGDGKTLGEVLGAFNTDTNNDAVDDGWTLKFAASRGSVTPEGALTP
jgi:hypothetical protein